MLKTGRRCTYDEIKVGEIFAVNGCWIILVKTQEGGLIICSDSPRYQYYFESYTLTEKTLKWAGDIGKLYKLPKSVQRLWLEEE